MKPLCGTGLGVITGNISLRVLSERVNSFNGPMQLQ